jgi:hypothetical protein
LGFCAASLHPLLWAAVWLIVADLYSGQILELDSIVGVGFLLLIFPLLAAAAAAAVQRFAIPCEKSTALPLLAGVAAMYLELCSEPFLKIALLRSGPRVESLDVALAFLTDGTLIVTLPVACVMIMVLLFEVPFRMVVRAGGLQEVETAASLVRGLLSLWVLLAGATLTSEVVTERYLALLERVLS